MLQIVFGKVVLVASLAVDRPLGEWLRVNIKFAQAVDYDVCVNALIEDLSAYMQSTGRKYADHAATLRSWSARKKRQQKPGTGIPDYTYNEEESL